MSIGYFKLVITKFEFEFKFEFENALSGNDIRNSPTQGDRISGKGNAAMLPGRLAER